MVAILIIPKLLSLKNRFLQVFDKLSYQSRAVYAPKKHIHNHDIAIHNEEFDDQSFPQKKNSLVTLFFQVFKKKETIITFSTLIIFQFIYSSTAALLTYIKKNPTLSVLPPSFILSSILFTLLIMIFLSNLISAITLFYSSDDLDLLLAAPLEKFTFFVGRFIHLFINTSWMPIVFLCPFLFAHGVHYQAGFTFFISIPLLLTPFFILPSGIAVITATLLCIALPPRNSLKRRILNGLVVILIILLILVCIKKKAFTINSQEQILEYMHLVWLPHATWSPANWVAGVLEALLFQNSLFFQYQITALYSSALFIISLAFLVIFLFHEYAYTKYKEIYPILKRKDFFIAQLFDLLLLCFEERFRPVIKKDWSTLTREVSQIIEIVLLLSLATLFTYNVRVFVIFEALRGAEKLWWSYMFFGINTVIGSFLSIAIASRFVYPSLSREGKAFWIIQSSPLSLEALLKAKFYSWLVTITLITSFIIVSGTYFLNISGLTLFLSIPFAYLTAYSIVSLAIGFGCIYANFTWESPSDLSGSYGSFLFMVSGICIVLLTLLPLYILLKIHSFNHFITEDFYILTMIGTIILQALLYPRMQNKIFNISIQGLELI
jgi:ABC-2 type transport system permease protein